MGKRKNLGCARGGKGAHKGKKSVRTRKGGGSKSQIEHSFDRKEIRRKTAPKTRALEKARHGARSTLMGNFLEGAKFRLLNEKLYNLKGSEIEEMFAKDDDLFRIYHSGYEKQVASWQLHPLDGFISKLDKLPQTLTVADLGCGNARLAQSIPQKEIHSFDLVKVNKYVTVADITKVPLSDGSVDVVVSCLALMSTDYVKTLAEAFRILKNGGKYMLAEVTSRFEDIDEFCAGMEAAGFRLRKREEENTYFISLIFEKSSKNLKTGALQRAVLWPIRYKKR